ncbi:hypothetical protein [Planctomicrobium sp. SH527]|uniref:hypothetical protein n=1 Tax=Planctomicrobium sp. SH527 TaxID=3448123 RepID=UPI003F5C7442
MTSMEDKKPSPPEKIEGSFNGLPDKYSRNGNPPAVTNQVKSVSPPPPPKKK